MAAPEGILCSKTHEWILKEGNQATVGLTDYAVEQLGDVVFIELPEVDSAFEKNEVFATIESVKAASEIYMPVKGRVIETNQDLINSPELINEDPYSAWLVKIECSDFAQDSQELLEYNDYIEEVE